MIPQNDAVVVEPHSGTVGTVAADTVVLAGSLVYTYHNGCMAGGVIAGAADGDVAGAGGDTAAGAADAGAAGTAGAGDNAGFASVD